ncbi:hypothetical protein [Streptomyces benahoarensis]|uniref:Uncharacterized protein n=1 Tax=Streptomyces benahoarensis TaxID=2595054 RepID=A0A553YW06_9ACTN|nr:hypothetical protein [Streptomyces benahoarensis]TSB23193.1 hypothetical protein FNJ62_15440 [Streptomyces benahoarensis]TSB33376.1 hypothetical protein FNZ23_23765 [Streptomyces benahoarensis]
MSGEESYVEHGELMKLARSFEQHAYDLEAHLRKFSSETGEEAITDGFGVLTESEEVTTAYIEYSEDVAGAVKSIYTHLDSIGAALKQVTKNTEANDENVGSLFGNGGVRK